MGQRWRQWVTLCLCFVLTSSAPHFLVDKSTQLALAAGQGYHHAQFLYAQAIHMQEPSKAFAYARQALAQGNKLVLPWLLTHQPYKQDDWYRQGVPSQQLEALLWAWQQDPSNIAIKETISDLFVTAVNQYPLTLRGQYWLAQFLLQEQYAFKQTAPSWWTWLPQLDDYWLSVLMGEAILQASTSSCDFEMYFFLETPQAEEKIRFWIGQLAAFLQKRGYSFCAQVSNDYLALSEVSETKKTEVGNQEIKQIDCHPKKQRAFCVYSEEQLPQQAIPVFVTEAGLANTRNRIIYMSRQSNWQVLLHEMGHALGLADEYPMSTALAVSFCQQQYDFDAKNIVISHTRLQTDTERDAFLHALPWSEWLEGQVSLPIDVSGQVLYRLGSLETEGIGLFPASTCELTEKQAWKPVARATFMEYYESNYVPDLYLQWMHEEMQARY